MGCFFIYAREQVCKQEIHKIIDLGYIIVVFELITLFEGNILLFGAKLLLQHSEYL